MIIYLFCIERLVQKLKIDEIIPPPPLKYHNKYFFKNPLNSQGFFTKLYYLYFLNQVMPLRKCMHYICSGSL